MYDIQMDTAWLPLSDMPQGATKISLETMRLRNEIRIKFNIIHRKLDSGWKNESLLYGSTTKQQLTISRNNNVIKKTKQK